MVDRLPDWARWNPVGGERPWSVGVEEEILLLDPVDWSPVDESLRLLHRLPRSLAARVAPETHGCVVELRSGPCDTVGALAVGVAALRSRVERVAATRLGLRAASMGMHPAADRGELVHSEDARYRLIGSTMRALSRRAPTLALHVHVGVPDGPTAVRALDGLRDDLAVLLALSANSPFWRGADSGFASMRTPMFSMFPRVGVPRAFGTFEEYVRVVERLMHAGAVPEPTFLWWDARLQPKLGTVEVRVMDAQTRVADVAGIAALIQCLVRRHAGAGPRRAEDAEVLAENRFLAARDGVAAQLLTQPPGHSAGDAAIGLLDECRPYADALGCTAELEGAAELIAFPGYARQRRIAAVHGVEALPACVAHEFTESASTALVEA